MKGIGRHVAQPLLAKGEAVVDVPAKLSARVRVFATGQGRKTDDTDAHSIALVGVRMGGPWSVVDDEQLELLRLLADRRRHIGEELTRRPSTHPPATVCVIASHAAGTVRSTWCCT